MKHVRSVTHLAARQEGVLSHWQLVAAAWSRGRIAHATRDLRSLHDGVWLTGAAPVTDLQLWWAATLTAPRTVLADFSAGACWEVRPLRTPMTAVVRPGASGPRQHGTVRVRYSQTLAGDVTRRHGLLITTPERTVIDLWPRLAPRAAARVLRETIRLGHTDVSRMLVALERHRGRRGTATLAATVGVYARLPLDRCRSDAEIEGLLVLDAAGVPLPEVNRKWAGEEADFCWAARRLIIEIDGPQWHLDALENARKTRAWTRAGFDVRRIPSDDVYLQPERLLALTR